MQLSENVPITGTSTNKNLHDINSISKLIHFLQPLHFNRQQIVDDTCYACSSSHYVTTILIHFHMQTSQDPNFIFDTQLHIPHETLHIHTQQISICHTLSHLMLSCSMASARLLLRKFSITS